MIPFPNGLVQQIGAHSNEAALGRRPEGGGRPCFVPMQALLFKSGFDLGWVPDLELGLDLRDLLVGFGAAFGSALGIASDEAFASFGLVRSSP